MPVQRRDRSPFSSPYHRQPVQHRLASPFASPTLDTVGCPGSLSLSGSSFASLCSPPTSLAALEATASSTVPCTSSATTPAGPFRCLCSATARGADNADLKGLGDIDAAIATTSCSGCGCGCGWASEHHLETSSTLSSPSARSDSPTLFSSSSRLGSEYAASSANTSPCSGTFPLSDANAHADIVIDNETLFRTKEDFIVHAKAAFASMPSAGPSELHTGRAGQGVTYLWCRNSRIPRQPASMRSKSKSKTRTKGEPWVKCRWAMSARRIVDAKRGLDYYRLDECKPQHSGSCWNIIKAEAQRAERVTRAPSPEARPRLATPTPAPAAAQPGKIVVASPQHASLADIARMEIDRDAKVWLEFLHALQRPI